MVVEPCRCTKPGWCDRYKREMTPKLFHLCQTNEQYRKLWDDKVNGIKKKPVKINKKEKEISTTKKLSNYRKAIVKWISAGRPVRSDEEVERIYNQFCNSCEFKLNRSCILCGCKVNKAKSALFNKIKMATEECPKGFWK